MTFGRNIQKTLEPSLHVSVLAETVLRHCKVIKFLLTCQGITLFTCFAASIVSVNLVMRSWN